MFNTIAMTGNRVSFHGLHATLTTLPDSSVALCFDKEKQPTVIKTRSEIESEFGKTLHLIPKGKVAAPTAPNVSVADFEEVKRRSAYLDELRRRTTKGGIGGVKIRQQVIARVAREIRDPKPISPATLARWARQTQRHSHGVASTLKPKTRQRKSSFSQDIQDLALEVIDDYYLQLGNPTVQYAYDCFTEEFEHRFGQGAKRPCREVFRKWAAQACDPIEFIEKREGRRAAKAAMRNAKKKLRAERILERVEADAVNLAIGVTDDEGRYLGTVTLFAVIDVHSRSVLGLVAQVGRGESAGSVIDSYRHAICPKSSDDLPHTVQNNWPMYGAPETFVSDGGSGYASVQTQSFLLDVGSDSQIVQTYAGWRKPFVERFFLTLRTRFAQTLKGYCGKHTDRPNLDATIKEKASMTLQEFRTALYEWVVDEYHQLPHRGLNGKTPYEVWEEQAQVFPPHLPTNYERIRFTMGETRMCTISGPHSHQGIQLNNLRYNDADNRLKTIGMVLQRQGQAPEVMVEYTHNDVYSVNVVDPITEEVFKAVVVDEDIEPGTTLAELKVSRPSSYANKGFTGRRRAKSSPTFINANAAHDENSRLVRSRRSQRAATDPIEAELERLRKEDDTLPPPTARRRSTSSESEEPTSEEFGTDGVYEDD